MRKTQKKTASNQPSPKISSKDSPSNTLNNSSNNKPPKITNRLKRSILLQKSSRTPPITLLPKTRTLLNPQVSGTPNRILCRPLKIIPSISKGTERSLTNSLLKNFRKKENKFFFELSLANRRQEEKPSRPSRVRLTSISPKICTSTGPITWSETLEEWESPSNRQPPRREKKTSIIIRSVIYLGWGAKILRIEK